MFEKEKKVITERITVADNLLSKNPKHKRERNFIRVYEELLYRKKCYENMDFVVNEALKPENKNADGLAMIIMEYQKLRKENGPAQKGVSFPETISKGNAIDSSYQDACVKATEAFGIVYNFTGPQYEKDIKALATAVMEYIMFHRERYNSCTQKKAKTA